MQNNIQEPAARASAAGLVAPGNQAQANENGAQPVVQERDYPVNVELDPGSVVRSSCGAFLWHFAVIVLLVVALSNQWCFLEPVQRPPSDLAEPTLSAAGSSGGTLAGAGLLQKAQEEPVDSETAKTAEIEAAEGEKSGDEKLNKVKSEPSEEAPSSENKASEFASESNDSLGTLIRGILLFHLVNCLLNGSFIVIIFQSQRQAKIVYKCKFAMSFVVFLFLSILILIYGLQFGKILKKLDAMPGDFGRATFTRTTTLILCEEVVHVLLQMCFIVDYMYKFRMQLFPDRYRQEQQDRQAARAIVRPGVMPQMTYQQLEKLDQTNEVQECMQRLIHITLTKGIIRGNLRPKSGKSEMDKITFAKELCPIKDEENIIQTPRQTAQKTLPNSSAASPMLRSSGHARKVRFGPTHSPLQGILSKGPKLDPLNGERKAEHAENDLSFDTKSVRTNENAPCNQGYNASSIPSMQSSSLSQQSNWREKYDQIESLECAICMDEMVEGEIVVKTFCGQKVLNKKVKAKASTKDTQSALSPFKSSNESQSDESLLKGHKFHKQCLYSWLQKGKFLNDDTNAYEFPCPLCRCDIMTEDKEEESVSEASNNEQQDNQEQLDNSNNAVEPQREQNNQSISSEVPNNESIQNQDDIEGQTRNQNLQMQSRSLQAPSRLEPQLQIHQSRSENVHQQHRTDHSSSIVADERQAEQNSRSSGNSFGFSQLRQSLFGSKKKQERPHIKLGRNMNILAQLQQYQQNTSQRVINRNVEPADMLGAPPSRAQMRPDEHLEGIQQANNHILTESSQNSPSIASEMVNADRDIWLKSPDRNQVIICRGPGTYDSYYDDFNQESNTKLKNEDMHLNNTIDLISAKQFNSAQQSQQNNRRSHQNSATIVQAFDANVKQTLSPMQDYQNEFDTNGNMRTNISSNKDLRKRRIPLAQVIPSPMRNQLFVNQNMSQSQISEDDKENHHSHQNQAAFTIEVGRNEILTPEQYKNKSKAGAINQPHSFEEFQNYWHHQNLNNALDNIIKEVPNIVEEEDY